MNRIFLDFDETIFPHTPLARAFVREHYGVELPADFHAGHDLRKLVNDDRHPEPEIDQYTFWTHYADNLLCCAATHRNIKPIPGAEEVILELARTYKLWVVTARQSICRPVVEALIDNFFPGCFEGIHFVWERTPNGYKEYPKADFITEMGGGTLFVDDNPGEVLSMRNIVDAHLFDPHGFHDDHPEIRNRFRSWDAIGEWLL